MRRNLSESLLPMGGARAADSDAVARPRARALHPQHGAVLHTRGELQFTTEANGLKADGSEFVGEMSWGIVDTSAGPMLLAVGRDVSHRRTAEARLLAVAAMSEHAPADIRVTAA